MDERLTDNELRLIIQGLGSEFAHQYPEALARELLAARVRVAMLEAALETIYEVLQDRDNNLLRWVTVGRIARAALDGDS